MSRMNPKLNLLLRGTASHVPAVLLAVFLAPAPARADELAPIVVNEEMGRPSRETIDSAEIEAEQAEDLEDVFRNSPDVIVGGGTRNAQKVYIRGFEDTQMNVTIDGARQSGYLFHHQGRLPIEPELMKQIAVEAGTGDALAGPGALGGALRFETKDAEDLLLDGLRVGAFAKAAYHTNAEEMRGTLALFGKPTETLSVLAFGTLSKNSDYRAGGGDRVPYTSAKPRSGLGKMVWRPTPLSKLTYSAVLRTDNNRRLLRANIGPSGSALANTNDQEFENTVHSLAYERTSTGDGGLLGVDAYHSETSLRFANSSTNPGGAPTSARSRSAGISARRTLRFDRLTFTPGAETHRDRVRSVGAARTNLEESEILAGFAQAVYAASARWTFGAGARFDHYRLTNVDGSELGRGQLSPSARVGFRWNEIFESQLHASRAFRGPVPMEAFILSGATGVAPAAQVEGTVADTVEITQSGTWKDGEAATYRAAITGYFTELRHPLEARIVSGNATRANAEDIYSRGVNLSAGAAWTSLSAEISFARNDVKFGGQPLGYSSNNRGSAFGDRLNLGANYRLPGTMLTAGWDALFAFRLKDVPPAQLQQPGYGIHDATLGWLPSERVRVGLAVHNLFDKRYVAQGTQYSVGGGAVTSLVEPGRDFRLSASFTL